MVRGECIVGKVFESFRATREGEHPVFVSAQQADGTLQIRTGYVNEAGQIREDFELFATEHQLMRGFRAVQSDYKRKGYKLIKSEAKWVQ